MSRILVAEDDPHILRLIAMWLKRNGHDVVEARNGNGARDLVVAETFDVLVTDINMPGLDGIQLIEAVVSTGHIHRGIVVLTNRWDHGEIRERLSQWDVRVIPKPFSPSRLSEVVDKLTAVDTSEAPHEGFVPDQSSLS